MLSPSGRWVPLGLLILCAKQSFGEDTILDDAPCTSDHTIFNKTTSLLPTTIGVTHYVDVPVTHFVDVTYYKTETSTVVECVTESTTTTLHYTDLMTETHLETLSFTETDLETVSTTKTDLETITNTDFATITNTETDSATVTTFTTKTIFSTTYDPCPTTCSISVETVNLYFWPTNRPYNYPSTYVDTAMDYTFVSPSVYVFIPTARGTNSLGPTGPSTTNWMLPLELDEVSTVFDGSITRQLTLSDLGTDCPQTVDPTAIATMVDSRCDPVLAAPKQVSSWAYPCNACNRFGLFDPPYAIPTITGGLVEPTTSAAPAPITTVAPAPVKTTAIPGPTIIPEVGVLLIIYYNSDGDALATATVTTTGVSGTHTSSLFASATPTATATATSTPVSSSKDPGTSGIVSSSESVAPVSSSPSTPSSTVTPPMSAPSASVATASAKRVTGGLLWLGSSVFVAVYLW